jgi:ATP diphosphatase
MASERADGFNFDDVCQYLLTKRQKRNHYLMSDNPNDWPQTEAEEWQIWLAAKQQHKEKLANKKPLENLFTQQTKGLPILQQLEKTIKNYRMWDGGYIYPPTDNVDLFELLQDEVAEVKQELDAPTLNKQCLQDELGDVVLNLAVLAVQHDVSLETAAMSANQRFQNRFLAVENAMFAAGVSKQKWHELTPQLRLDLWDQAKKLEIKL